MEFKQFKQKLQEHFQQIIQNHNVLFLTDVDKDIIWDTYLNSFSDEERQGHNCNCCKQFLRPYANVVVIENNKLKSMWDFDIDSPFTDAIKQLSALVLSAPVKDVFVPTFPKLGTDFNRILFTEVKSQWEL